MINAKKKFLEGGVYHVYNRGVNRADIFFTEEDFDIFVWLLRRYLVLDSKSDVKNYGSRINLLGFCFKTNHFHFLLQQKDKTAMTEFMHSFLISFTARINKRYGRVGHLFQGIYKGRFITCDYDLMGISRYIHLNGGDSKEEILEYPHSSIHTYLKKSRNFEFVDTSLVLGIFSNSTRLYDNFLWSDPSLINSTP